MAIKSRNAIFPYSFKTVASADVVASSTPQNQIGIEIVNPYNFYSCEGLFLNFIFLHDGNNAGRNITAVTVQSDATTTPATSNSVSISAVTSGLTVSLAMDVTSLRIPTGRNVIYLTFDNAISGTIKLFKADMLYQVLGLG